MASKDEDTYTSSVKFSPLTSSSTDEEFVIIEEGELVSNEIKDKEEKISPTEDKDTVFEGEEKEGEEKEEEKASSPTNEETVFKEGEEKRKKEEAEGKNEEEKASDSASNELFFKEVKEGEMEENRKATEEEEDRSDSGGGSYSSESGDCDCTSLSVSDSDYDSHMVTDSQDEFKNLVRTLRHYRRRRRRRRRRDSSASRSVDSNCSCSSCVSEVNSPFFGTEEGPPGGEDTLYRRGTLWLESIKYVWGIVVYGLLLAGVIFTGAAIWAYNKDTHKDKIAGQAMLKWTVPLLVVTLLFLFVWRGTWHIMIWKGYGKGDHLVNRRTMIQFAQKKELLYTIRGAIYAPVKLNPKFPKKPHVYKAVSCEAEYDSEEYFDSDLEDDGQYRRDIEYWKDIEDPYTSDKRNIYTRKAWFRDVPIVWWELWNQPPRDF